MDTVKWIIPSAKFIKANNFIIKFFSTNIYLVNIGVDMGNFEKYYEQREVIDALTEVINFELELLQLAEYKKTHPGKGIPDKKKSDIVKKARRGEDMFGHGKNFEKIAKEAGKRYGDEDAGKRVAGAIFWKKAKGKHMTKEEVDDMIWIIEDDVEIILDHAAHTHEILLNEKNWIKDAVNPAHKGFCTPMSKPTCTPRRKALARRFKKGIEDE
jgi:hypothetical protein